MRCIWAEKFKAYFKEIDLKLDDFFIEKLQNFCCEHNEKELLKIKNKIKGCCALCYSLFPDILTCVLVSPLGHGAVG